ncbi:hypothetical protein RclHR1_09940004 [Rhizophagus clarus]|uniref:Uncharacterized protein n=1 Tax=Rhizophagus clarus TaxID=94130 RepID=A0A2Z6S694_9GLOM|nr:hypothetical protein RclHR1_09940004 [Rhizophagus clarus]
MKKKFDFSLNYTRFLVSPQENKLCLIFGSEFILRLFLFSLSFWGKKIHKKFSIQPFFPYFFEKKRSPTGYFTIFET